MPSAWRNFPGVLRKSGVIRVIPTCQSSVGSGTLLPRSQVSIQDCHPALEPTWAMRWLKQSSALIKRAWSEMPQPLAAIPAHEAWREEPPPWHPLRPWLSWSHQCLEPPWICLSPEETPQYPPVIVNLTTGTSNLLYINLKKTSAQQIQGAAFRRQRMYGLRSAKRWYASIFSSWPWHGVAYLSWHFSEATQEQRSIDQFIYKPWHCKYKY